MFGMPFEEVFMNFEEDILNLNWALRWCCYQAGSIDLTSNVTVPSGNQNIGWGVVGGRIGVLNPPEVAPVETGATRTYRLHTQAGGGDPQ